MSASASCGRSSALRSSSPASFATRHCSATAGLALFGLSLAKIFLFDLSALSSVARALSFIAVGGLVLAGGFFLQKLTASRQSV